jgi:type IV pilus assembly protein PilY1
MSDNVASYSHLVNDERLYWKSQWSGYNKMYYNPMVKYQPWPNKSDADTASPRSNPENASPTLDLTANFVTLTNSIIIDNKDDGFTKTGDWYYDGNHGEAYDNDFWDTSNATGVAYTAKWTPSNLAAGTYEVFAWWRSYSAY